MKTAKKTTRKTARKAARKTVTKAARKTAKKATARPSRKAPPATPARKAAKKTVTKAARKTATKAARKTAARPRTRAIALTLPARAPRAQSERRGDLDTVSWWDDFYRVIRRIPAGRVSTYGAIAAFAGHPRAARHVGYALAALKETGKNRDVPWQRVLGAAARGKARVTIKDPIGGALQRGLLEAEGVTFDALGRVALAAFGWTGPKPARRRGA